MFIHLKSKLREFKQSLRQQQAQAVFQEAHLAYSTHKAEVEAEMGAAGKSKNGNKNKKKIQLESRKQLDEDVRAFQEAQRLVEDVELMARQDEQQASEEQCLSQLYMCMGRGVVQVYIYT